MNGKKVEVQVRNVRKPVEFVQMARGTVDGSEIPQAPTWYGKKNPVNSGINYLPTSTVVIEFTTFLKHQQ